MTPKRASDQYPPEQADRRFKTALRAALSMPPIPHAESSRKSQEKDDTEAPPKEVIRA
jgi:hypothetical protein